MRTAKKPVGHKRGQVTPRQLEAVREVLLGKGAALSEIAQRLGLANESGARVLLRTPLLNGLVAWKHQGRGPSSQKVMQVTPRGLNALAHHSMMPDIEAPGAKQFAKGARPWNLQAFPVSCGPLREAFAEPRWIMGPADFFRHYRDGDYMLDADGDSMECEGRDDAIWRGDCVLLRPSVMPASGEIVHAEYVKDGVHECTLKEFHYDETSRVVTLRAFNPVYDDIVLPGTDVFVHGIVMEILHRLRTSGRK